MTGKVANYFRKVISAGTFLLCTVVISIQASALSTDIPPLIPMPQQVRWTGHDFLLNNKLSEIKSQLVKEIPGVPFNADEAYCLIVKSDSVILKAITPVGLFYGRQTLNQLTYTKNNQQFLAGCEITDWPAFHIRGFMQDVGRNFMSLPVLKEQIDILAAYKFNTFHLHLTDNPGWRLESKKYPQLKDAGTMSRFQGKYYSQKDFLELVNYCYERHIYLIPEFDIPGHSAAFRKAFQIDSMSDNRVKPILTNLIDELCDLVPKEKMPYIHLGTDEVWTKNERPAKGLLDSLIARIQSHQREVIVWRPGTVVGSDATSITQLWSSKGTPKAGHCYLDSRLNYINHLDPLAGVVQLYFDRLCNAAHGDSLRLGGILCCWNDNRVENDYDILRLNPVFPCILTYSETSWKGQSAEIEENFLAKLPPTTNPLFEAFRNFEDRLIRHRDLYFKGKPFQYVRQTGLKWTLHMMAESIDSKMITEIETLERNGISLPVRLQLKVDSKTVNGGTIHINHFFGYPSLFSEKKGVVVATTKIWSPKYQKVGCWIGFHDWSRSGGRRGGPLPMQGQWLATNPKVWVNQLLVRPPVWKNPGLKADSEEIPFVDENYDLREPIQVIFKKGWNTVAIKVPQDGKAWKWMFTFVPVRTVGLNVKEMEELKCIE